MTSDSVERQTSKPILVVSPSTRGGSWRWIQEVLQAAGLEKDCRLVAYGTAPDQGPGSYGGIVLPFISYEGVGLWMSRHPILIPLYTLPLLVATYLAFVRWRPRAIIANGVLLAVASVPYSVLSGAKIFLAYHGYVGNWPTWGHALLRAGLKRVYRAFVNSTGSEIDLALVMTPRRICRIEHWADDVYFERRSPAPQNDGRLRVLYVGRLDDEKVGFLLDVIGACSQDNVEFAFVGAGPYSERIAQMSLLYPVTQFGYVEDKARLAEIYSQADILWGVADDTYVAKPVVEALASGVPVIVPDVPAVHVRAERGTRVPRDLLPASVGWIIDGHDIVAARATLLAAKDLATGMRNACRAYAATRFSAANLATIIKELRTQSKPDGTEQ